MNYTLRDITDLMNDLAERMGGNFRGAPEPRDLMRQINWGMMAIAEICEPYEAGIEFSPVANKSTYILSDLRYFGRIIIRPDQVVFAGDRLRGPSDAPYGVFTHKQALDYHPNYRTATNFSRDMAVYSGGNKLDIFPTPTSARLASGASYVDGVIVPGWHLSDGTYWPGGVPLGTDFAIGGGTSSTSGVSTNSPATVSTVGTFWTTPDNIKADDGANASLAASLTLIPAESEGGDEVSVDILNDTFLRCYNFGVAIPIGATSISLNIESLQTGSTGGYELILQFVEDITDDNSVAVDTQTLIIEPGSAMAEVGPFPPVTTLSRSQINSTNFGVRVIVNPYSTSPILTPYNYDAQFDFISLKASWSMPGTSISSTESSGGPGGTTRAETDWEAIPDLPPSLHMALAAFSAFHAANPVADSQEANQTIARIMPGVMDSVRRYAHECASASIAIVEPVNPFRRRV